MSDYDVIIIGAGAAGLSAGALLAKEGQKVLVLERSPYLGGRGMATNDEGYELNLGAHLMEDSGSGLTRIFEHVELKSEGSFIDAELVIRAQRLGYQVIQFGVDYFPRTRGVSTLSSPSVIVKILREMRQLRAELDAIKRLA